MVTDINDIIARGGAEEIELSGWDDDAITVKVKRPTFLSLAAAGRIPNPLIPVVEKLLMGQANEAGDITETAKALHVIAGLTLVEPKLSTLEEAGVTLTDMQIQELYAYALAGVTGLAAFRGKLRGTASKHGRKPANKG